MKEYLTKLVLEVKTLEGSKGRPNTKSEIKEKRKKILELMPNKYVELEDFILEKQYNPVLEKEHVLIFTKESFKKRADYFEKQEQIELQK